VQTLDGKPVFTEDAQITGVRRTRDGFLVADVRAARTGIYQYSGSEVGRPDLASVRIYRPESSVFDKKTLASFTSLDITNDHPKNMVNSKNWKRYAVGHTGEDVIRDGDYLRVPIIVKDEETIREIQDGKRSLSFGYLCDIDFSPGETESGEKYDGIQKSLIGNHLAIVNSGRAGDNCKIGDQGGANKMSEKIITFDGMPIAATDQSEAAIRKLEGTITSLNNEKLKLTADGANEVKALKDKVSELEAKLAAKDKDLGAKDAELKTLKDANSDVTELDRLVNDRVNVLADAKKLGLSDAECKNKSNQEIIREIVKKNLGDDAVKDRSDDYIRASFDFLASKGSGRDPIADHMRGSRPHFNTPTTDFEAREKAFQEMVDRNANAWKDPFNRENRKQN
jgi:hypothetical protein